MGGQKVSYVQFAERNLNKKVFEKFYTLTGITENQKELSLEGKTQRLSVSNYQIHKSVTESKEQAIKIYGHNIKIVMRRRFSPEIRDYMGDVWSSKEDWCVIRFSSTPEAMKGFKEASEEELSLFLEKVEELIRKIIREAPAVAEETKKKNMNSLMNSI